MPIPPAQKQSLPNRSSSDGSIGNEQRQAITLCTCNWKRSNPTARLTCASHHGRPQGGEKRAFASLEIGSMKQNFLENLKSEA